MLFNFLRREHLYSRLGNVRVNRKTMVVERLYIVQIERSKDGRGKIKKTAWKTVDYKTTYFLNEGNRPCPPDNVRKLLQTAF